MIKTRYPLFDVKYMAGYVPWDLHALNLPYHAHFDKYDWLQGAGLMAKNGVNATRFFLSTGEKEGDLDNFILPFLKQPSGKFDLTQFGLDFYEIEARLQKFWERDIWTVICIASGIKENRFQHTVWHRKNNINETTDDYRYFMIDPKTIDIYKAVLKNLWEAWVGKPVIFEFINEPPHDTVIKFRWYDWIMNYAKQLGIARHHFAFEKWDSSKIIDLLEAHGCWMFDHGVNHVNYFKRFHRGEMQEIYEAYDWIAADSDGHKISEGEWDLRGKGLKGLSWNDNFRRPSPKHMKDGLIYDHKHGGKGWIIMSAAAYYKHANGDQPNFVDWQHAAIPGLNKDECKSWSVDWRLFSYQKGLRRKPLGELKAIRKAMRKLFGG